MLDNLLSLVKEFSGDAVVNNPAVPNEHNEAVMSASSSSIMNSLQNMVNNGGFKDVLNLLGGKGGEINSNPVAQGISNNLIGDLMNKFNFNQGQASQIAGGMLPGLLSNLVSRTNDPSNSSFDLNGIMSSLTGGKSSGINLQSLLDRDGDGDTDMQDLMKMFSGGQGQSGGLMDMLKGVVGK